MFQNFERHDHWHFRHKTFTIFQSGRNNGVKIWVFDATRGISRYRKLPSDIDFTGEVIAQCYVPLVKILL